MVALYSTSQWFYCPNGRKASSLQLVFAEALLRHETPHQLLQETGNYYTHHFSSLLAHCSNHSPPSHPESHLPPPVSSSSCTSTEKASWQNKCGNRSLLAHISLPGSSLFPIIILGRDKCLSRLLSGCTTAAWDFGYLSFFFFYYCTYFTLLWIRVSA